MKISQFLWKIYAWHTPHYENRQVGEANEVPFEVPEGWEWTTINDICSKIGSGSTPRGSNYAKEGIPFFRSQNVYNDGLVYDDIKYISEEVHENMIGTEVRAKDLLLNITGGSLGRCAIVPDEFQKGNVSQHVCILRTIIVLPAYLHLFIISDYFAATMILSGSGREGLPKYSLETMQFPLPPIEEQKRIVAAVNKWFALIDTLETAKEDLQTSITLAKSKILDLAIHGKLVPQDPNDEPAIELLKRINPKFTPCDNAHYENLPKGWTVCALEEIIDYEQPQAYIVQSVDYKSHYKTPVLTAGKSFIIGYTNESEGIFTDLPVIIFDDFTTDSKFVDFPFKVKSSAMKILHVKEEVNIQYVCWIMSITRLIGDTHKRYWISEYSKLHIPIPPRKEQDRIINKVNELFHILDNISAEL